TLLVAALVLELAPLAYRSRFLRSDVWRNPPDYVRFLQGHTSGFRVHAVHDLALTPNVGEGLGIRTISSRVSFNSARLTEIIRRYFPAPNLPYPIAQSVMPTDRNVLDVLGVKYLVTFDAAPAEIAKIEAAGFTAAHPDAKFEILENPRSFPLMY